MGTQCTANSTAIAGQTAITACNCNANFYGTAQTTAGTCSACPNDGTLAGQSSATATATTDCKCPIGTYGTNASAGCTACPTGFTTATDGKTLASDCNVCAVNYFGTGAVCTKCPASYVSVGGGAVGAVTTMSACLCPAGQYNSPCASVTGNCYGCVAAAPTAAPTLAPDADAAKKDGLSSGALAGIIIGAIWCCRTCWLLFLLHQGFRCRKRWRSQARDGPTQGLST